MISNRAQKEMSRHIHQVYKYNKLFRNMYMAIVLHLCNRVSPCVCQSGRSLYTYPNVSRYASLCASLCVRNRIAMSLCASICVICILYWNIQRIAWTIQSCYRLGLDVVCHWLLSVILNSKMKHSTYRDEAFNVSLNPSNHFTDLVWTLRLID